MKKKNKKRSVSKKRIAGKKSSKRSPVEDTKRTKIRPTEKPAKQGVSSLFTRRKFLQAGAGTLAGIYTAGCLPEDYMGRPEPKKRFALQDDNEIVRAAIHPAIGVARIGNSADEYFIGPEVESPLSRQPGFYRDANGAIKRQAARFRVYGYNKSGRVVRELSHDDAEISWSVHLANKKAAWYRFIVAMDLPEAKDTVAPLRNAGVPRSEVTIDSGTRTVSGTSSSGAAQVFDGGKFKGKPVGLGELRTDEKGRLLVLSGLGKAESPQGASIFSGGDTFANADGWYDDIADGPVHATVSVGGTEIPVEPAWVFVGPPNYAPDVISFRTLYDLVYEAHVDAGRLPEPEETSFARDIYPMFERLTGLQWVNKGIADKFGAGTAMDFTDPALIQRMSELNPSVADQEFRKELVASFRTQTDQTQDRTLWPQHYGDAFGTFPDSPKTGLAISTLREKHLSRWLAGEFISDWATKPEPPRFIEQAELDNQPAILDKAALHFCVADAFHPGCEVTWPMRHVSMYSPMTETNFSFRILERDPNEAEPSYGALLDQATVLAEGGPLFAQGPGDLTKWMAIPWQVDTAFCRSGYEPEFDPYLPTFWPARVPNHVLTEDDYESLAVANPAARKAIFGRRESWVRTLKGGIASQMVQMVNEFPSMGIIEKREGILNNAGLPNHVYVENLKGADRANFRNQTLAAKRGRRARAFEAVPQGQPTFSTSSKPKFTDEQAEDAGFESAEQLREIRAILGID